MKRVFGSSAFFYLLMAFAFYAAYLLVKPYLGVIIFALVIVAMFSPVQLWFERKLSKRKGWATPLTILFVIFIILIPVIGIISLCFSQILQIAEDVALSGFIQDTSIAGVLKQVNGYLATIPVLQGYQIEESQIVTTLEGSVQSVAGFAQSIATRLGSNITKLIADAIVFFSVLASMFPNFGRFLEFIKSVSPLDDRLDQKYIDRILAMSKDMLKGIVVIAAVQALASGILLGLMGVPYLVLWTVLAFILSMVPLGANVVLVPIGITLILLGQVWAGGIIIAVGMLGISNIDNFLRPRLVSEEASLDPTLVLVGALGGLSLFGFLGVVYGPVLMIFLLTTIEIYRDNYPLQDDAILLDVGEEGG